MLKGLDRTMNANKEPLFLRVHYKSPYMSSHIFSIYEWLAQIQFIFLSIFINYRNV